MFGLQQKHIDAVNACFAQYPQIEQVLLYGSRAKGNYKKGSDIDLTIVGNLDYSSLLQLENQLDDLLLPYKIDLSLKHNITNPQLLDHIERFGKVFYEKEKQPAMQEPQTEYKAKPSEWKTYKLGDLINVKHGYAFKGEFFSDEPTKDILLTPGNFKIGGGFKTDKFKYYKGDYPADYILKEGDILITMTDLSKAGDILGYSARIPEHSGVRYLHNQRLGLVQFKNDEIDADFLYWVLRTKPYQYFIVSSATGSTVKHTSPTRICGYEFKAPEDKAEQRQIAQILSSLDDKIELNLQMNQTLEAMAQAIFKEWFVNFNFPGFDGELVDGLPKGWRKEPIDANIEFLNGLALQKYPPINDYEYLPVIKIRELRQGVTNSTDKASTQIPEKYIIESGDILFSWSGSLEVVMWCNGKGALNQHLFKLSSEKYPKWFYYYWTKHFLPIYQSIASDKATTMGHIQRRHLTESIINVPDLETFSEANKVLNPLLDKLQNNLLQIQTLIQTRDTLLPKLMSGKIEVAV